VTISVSSLFSVQTADKILQLGLEVASALGIPVSTWSAGDPTRSLYKYLAEVLATHDIVVAEFVKAGFLSSASGDWLTVLAEEVYGVTRTEATYATPAVTLSNAGGGNYPLAPGELTVRNIATDKTYHNTNSATIAPGATSVTFNLVADEAGSDSSVGALEITELVTTLLGVTITGSTVGLANDAESDSALRERCRASLGALSPSGPADAYSYVARSTVLTGVTGINRASAVGSSTGAVTVTIATASGPADAAALTAVQSAVLRWATPLCSNPTVVSASALTVNFDIIVYKRTSLTATQPEVKEAINNVIAQLFADVPIGGNGSPAGIVAASEIIDAIHGAFPKQLYRIEGVSNISLAPSQVPVLGTLAVAVL
jgi:phage-related baseplate assembly protein